MLIIIWLWATFSYVIWYILFNLKKISYIQYIFSNMLASWLTLITLFTYFNFSAFLTQSIFFIISLWTIIKEYLDLKNKN